MNSIQIFKYYFIFIFILFINVYSIKAQITVDTSFEGANTRILYINNSDNTVKIESKLRTGDVHNVVFYCKVSGFNLSIPLKIQVKRYQDYYLPVLAAYSYDQINWFRFYGIIAGDSKEFVRTYSQSPVYFSVGYPYVYSDMLNLVNTVSSSNFVQVSDLATSFGGRSIKLIRISEPCVPDSNKYLIWLLGRNHAMESHSNYVLEGLINFLISNNPKADQLRRQAIVYIVPIMDVDNAAVGGTGKDQTPIDFNRDWDSPSYWPAVIAVKQKIAETVTLNPLKIFLDSHDPFPGSPGTSERLFFYSLYSSGIKSFNLDFYRKLLLESGGYVFDRQPMYATVGQTSFRYIDSMYNNIDLPMSLETGWVNRTDNTVWTIPLYKFNGQVLGEGMNDYLSNIIKPEDIILDNNDTLSGVTITGQWYPSTNIGGYWGANYIHDVNTGKGTKSVKYNPQILQDGFYEVFIRYTHDAGRANNVPVKITWDGGVKDTIINQQIRGAEWLSLGRYYFTAGGTGYILIRTIGTNGFVIADAVRLSKQNNCNPISVKNKNRIPNKFSLSQNYPNPFNPSTKIKFDISTPLPPFRKGGTNVSLKIYDALGKEVATLINEQLKTGTYEVIFDGSNYASGVYYYKLIAGNFAETKRMVMVK